MEGFIGNNIVYKIWPCDLLNITYVIVIVKHMLIIKTQRQ